MKLNVNWRKFGFIYMILLIVTLAGGCSAAWLTAVNGMLPAILAAVEAAVSFVAALEGKTVPVGLTAKFQQWEQNVASLIATAQQIVTQIKSNSTATLLQQFQGVVQSLVGSLGTILADLNVTDNATVAKITGFVQLAVAAASAILALIPMAISKLGAPAAELKHYDAMGASAVTNAVKVMKETYVAIVTTPTENADVNAALKELPQSI